MDIDPLLILAEAFALPIDTERFGSSYDGPIGNNNVIRASYQALESLPVEAYAKTVRLVVNWLDRNVETAQAQKPNCHIVIREAITALNKIGGSKEAQDFLRRPM